MSKINFSETCTQMCLSNHNQRTKHRSQDFQTFKTKFNTFLYSDDDQWESIINIHDKIDEVQRVFRRFAEQSRDKILECRIKFALKLESSKGNQVVINAMKAASEEDYDQLTCKQAEMVSNHLKIRRNSNAREIKQITDELLGSIKNSAYDSLNLIFESEQKKTVVKTQAKRQTQKVYEVPHKILNDNPTLKIQDIEKTNINNFNIFLKVIDILQQQFYVKGFKCIQFTAGDDTGTATVVVDKGLRLIRPNTVIGITNARIFVFKGTKQIQLNPQSIISEEDFDIKINQNYCLSKYQHNKDIKKYRGTREGEKRRPRKPRQDRETREEPHRQSDRVRENQKKQEREARERERDQQRQRLERQVFTKKEEERSSNNNLTGRDNVASKRGNRANRQRQQTENSDINRRQDRPTREGRQERNERQRPQRQERPQRKGEDQLRRDRERNREERPTRDRREDNQKQLQKTIRINTTQNNNRRRQQNRYEQSLVNQPRRGNRNQKGRRDEKQQQNQGQSIIKKQNKQKQPIIPNARRGYVYNSDQDQEQPKSNTSQIRTKQSVQPSQRNQGQRFNTQQAQKQKPNYNKIGNIEPGDQQLTFFAEITHFKKQIPALNAEYIVCVLADQTGMVDAELPKDNKIVKEGATLLFKLVNADVHPKTHHIRIALTDCSSIQKTTIHMGIQKLKITKNISAQQWLSDEQEQQAEQPLIQDF